MACNELLGDIARTKKMPPAFVWLPRDDSAAPSKRQSSRIHGTTKARVMWGSADVKLCGMDALQSAPQM